MRVPAKRVELGSTRGITDANQALSDSRETDAFGLTVASAGSAPSPFGFVGGQDYQNDADSGLMLLGARYYDPKQLPVSLHLKRPTISGGGVPDAKIPPEACG